MPPHKKCANKFENFSFASAKSLWLGRQQGCKEVHIQNTERRRERDEPLQKMAFRDVKSCTQVHLTLGVIPPSPSSLPLFLIFYQGICSVGWGFKWRGKGTSNAIGYNVHDGGGVIWLVEYNWEGCVFLPSLPSQRMVYL